MEQAIEALKLNLDYPDITPDLPIVNDFLSIPKGKHEDYPNSQKIRNWLSNLYQKCKS